MYRILFALVLLLPLSPIPSEAFVFRKIVYCSPIEGFIHWQGKPLVNVQLTRELYSGGFEDGKNVDTTVTGPDGRFKFDVVQERRFLRPDLLSANPYVNQVVTVHHEGHQYLIWTFMKHDYRLGTESLDGVLRLECDIAKFEEGASARIVRCTNNGVTRSYE